MVGDMSINNEASMMTTLVLRSAHTYLRVYTRFRKKITLNEHLFLVYRAFHLEGELGNYD
jgi:hypothetical protein